jgi:hypothetical protein
VNWVWICPGSVEDADELLVATALNVLVGAEFRNCCGSTGVRVTATAPAVTLPVAVSRILQIA